ncbi:MAG: YqaE/Pmp3 family membrane protein [Pseudomonadota bacterium]|nr:YqaE/Pmp3 family membrane protein [Pseudomonadota bacterium]
MNIYLMALLAVLLPPLAVYLNAGLSRQFWINLLLTMLGFVPGVVHALYVVISYHRTR